MRALLPKTRTSRDGVNPGPATTAAAALALLLALAPAVAAQVPAPGAHLPGPDDPPVEGRSGGDGVMYIGTYAKSIAMVDEATGESLGRIPLQTGIPRSLTLSENRERFYVLDVSYENIEVVDIASRSTTTVHTLSEGDEQIRIWGLGLDPLERYMVLLVKSTRKLSDRYQVSGPMLLRYDLQSRTVTDTIPWPGGQEREGARLLFSADGETLYFFADDAILALETDGFTEVDRWEYGTALDDGMGRFNFGFPQQYWGGRDELVGLFRTTDPVLGRTIMGIARVRLGEREVEFHPLGPSAGVSFVLAPGGRKAYGLQQEVGNWQFWTFDVENGRVESRAHFRGRPRMALLPSTNGEVLYIYNAGMTIDLYDAATYRFLRTINLEGDNTTSLYVLPKVAEDR
jgi:hypothetical protein